MKQDVTEAFAQRLKALRKGAGLSQTQLGERLEVTHTSIYLYEKGSATPTVSTLAAIAELFGVTTDWLLGLSVVKTAATDRGEIYRQGYEDGKQICMDLMRAYVERGAHYGQE